MSRYNAQQCGVQGQMLWDNWLAYASTEVLVEAHADYRQHFPFLMFEDSGDALYYDDYVWTRL